VPTEPRRALVLAGGGIRVAWQAGVVQALDEAGLTFSHGDGTSGGIFTLGMLMSGVRPSELGQRWRTLRVQRFISFLPLRSYAKLPTNWAAFGGAKGVRTGVLPHLGIDVATIRRHTGMTGTFNVADFDSKVCVAIPHDEIDLERMIAGVVAADLPAGGAERGSHVDGCGLDQGRQPARGRPPRLHGTVAGLVHREHAAVGQRSARAVRAHDRALGQWCVVRRARCDRRHQRPSSERRESAGSSDPIVLHVVKPDLPLPLDPDFVAGRISAEALVAMGTATRGDT
jgi:hypothetical protein